MKYLLASLLCIVFGVAWMLAGDHAASAAWLAASLVLSSLAKERQG